MIEIKQTLIRADGSRVELSARGISLGAYQSLTGVADPAVWAELLKGAWEAAGEYWHEKILPKKFTHRGATEYGYAKRNRHYERKKLKLYGHTYPLVFTGESQREMLRIQDVRADAKGAKVYVHAPHHFFQYILPGTTISRKRGGQTELAHYKHGTPNKAAEVTAVSAADVAAVEKVVGAHIEAAGNRLMFAGGARGLQRGDIYAGHRASG